MRSLLQADHVVFLPLVLVNVVRTVAISEAQPRAVWEAEHPFRSVIFSDAAELPQKRDHVVFPEFRQRPPQQERVEPWRRKGKQHELATHGPALPAAARTAICRMPRFCTEEFALTWVGRSF